jgi:hypothetical protein
MLRRFRNVFAERSSLPDLSQTLGGLNAQLHLPATKFYRFAIRIASKPSKKALCSPSVG